MALHIRRFQAEDAPAIVELSLRAWAPVFESIEQALGNEILRRLHPDWRVSQQEAVERVCASEKAQVWVGEQDRVTAGFVALYLDPKARSARSTCWRSIPATKPSASERP